MRQWQCTVPPELEGCRVEIVLRRTLGLSITRIKRAKFQPNGILLDGQRVNTAAIVHAGQTVTVNLPEQTQSDLRPTAGEVRIVYEDEWLLAVDKAAGMPTHPCSGHYDDTLANRLAAVFQRRGVPFVFRSVNRLDIGTSGLLLVAKSSESQEKLQNLLHTADFVREYLALTDKAPCPPEGSIDLPIGPDPQRNAYCITPTGKAARTDYRLLATEGGISLIALRLHTGRTHQIRVHMASLDCPLLGDTLYGGQSLCSRVALHSHRIRLRHPFTGEVLQLSSPLPRELPWEGDIPT